MAAGIFVSYRRDDVRQAAGRLADDLAEHFGAAHIFRDIEGIELGVDFVEALNRALNDCVVMLVLIGPHWLDIRDAKGRRRLDDPRDWIRQEITTALERGIRVVPVLIDGTELPPESELPAELQPLVRRQALEIADSRWRGDLQRLVDTLARLPGLTPLTPHSRPAPPGPEPKPPAEAAHGRRPWLKWAAGAVVGLGVVGYIAQEFGAEGEPAHAPWQVNLPVPANSTIAPVNASGRTRPTGSLLEAPTAPLVTPAGEPLPDLNGLWRTLDGETYHVSQRGNQITLSASSGGMAIGNGQGQFDNGVLRLTMSMVVNGIPVASVNCNLQGSAGNTRFAGPCQGPTGQFVAQMFR